MEYSKLVAVTGFPGLFELINSKTDGAIVRSLEDKSTRIVSSRIHNFSHLESIEVYTVRDNVNLVELFNSMDKANETLPDDKDADAVKKYFEKVYAAMDFERVYASDMKKMVKWFAILKKYGVEIKLTEQPEEEPEVEELVEEDSSAPAPTAKKTAAKKKDSAAEETDGSAQPAKKTTRKKKSE